MSSVPDDASSEERYALLFHSHHFKRARQRFRENTNPCSNCEWWLPLIDRPAITDSVCLAAILPVMEGYVLCIRSEVWALPVSMDKFYDTLLSDEPVGDASFLSEVDISCHGSGERGSSSSPLRSATERKIESSAWSVKAAAHARLVCFPIRPSTEDNISPDRLRPVAVPQIL